MKFTHELDVKQGWVKKTYKQPKDFKKVEHLGKCFASGDMFVAYDTDNFINIYKGTLEEETLKTNTWYKSKDSDVLAYRTGDINNYSINDGLEYDNCVCTNPNAWTEATENEVEQALVAVAKEKGFKDIDKLKIKDFDGAIYPKGIFTCTGNNFYYYDNTLTLEGLTIFDQGTWIEILEDKPSLEERLKRIEEKLNI